MKHDPERLYRVIEPFKVIDLRFPTVERNATSFQFVSTGNHRPLEGVVWQVSEDALDALLSEGKVQEFCEPLRARK